MKTLIRVFAILLIAQNILASDNQNSSKQEKRVKIYHPIQGDRYISIWRNMSWQEFTDAIKNVAMDYKSFYSICSAKPISWENENPAYQREIFHHIYNYPMINMIPRLRGGNNTISDLVIKIRNSNMNEIFCSDGTCSICFDDESKKIEFTCGCLYCHECLNSFIGIFSSDGKNKCPIHKNTNLTGEITTHLFNHEEYDLAYTFAQLVDFIYMMKHMDFNFCKCGTLSNNVTGYAKQVCFACNECICFYCATPWDDKKTNSIGFCNEQCYYYSLLSFDLVDWRLGDSLIPNTRFCPGCGVNGAFDNKCKYHTCNCGVTFCFFCLKSQEDCKNSYRKSCYQKCTEAITQNLEDIFYKNKLAL